MTCIIGNRVLKEILDLKAHITRIDQGMTVILNDKQGNIEDTALIDDMLPLKNEEELRKMDDFILDKSNSTAVKSLVSFTVTAIKHATLPNN